MAEHRLIKMIDQLEGIKKSINKTGGIVRKTKKNMQLWRYIRRWNSDWL